MKTIIIEPNDQCMTNLVPNLNVGTGYYITFTNSVNYTDVYATSENFEVKADGSTSFLSFCFSHIIRFDRFC